MRTKSNEILKKERKALGYPDTLSLVEIDEILHRADTLSYLGLFGDTWRCLFAILWAYGKRISEVVELRTTDIAVRENILTITFTIRKKVRKSKKGVPIPKEKRRRPPRRTKRLTLDNKYAQIIHLYWKDCVARNQRFLFPREQTKMGHIYPQYVWDVIEMMGFEQPIWSHLFRHTLATELASNEISAFELKTWFDWESIETADEYVSSAGVGTKKITARKW